MKLKMNDIKIYFISFILFCPAILFCQESYTVPLVNKENGSPFSFGRSFGTPASDSIKLPEPGEYKNQIVCEYLLKKQLKNNKSGDPLARQKEIKFYYFTAIDTNNNVHVIVDTDFDRDFTNNREYIFPTVGSKDKLREDSTPIVSFDLRKFGRKDTVSFRLIPKILFPHLQLKSGNPFFDTTRVALENYEYKSGSFRVDNTLLYVYVYNEFLSLNYGANHRVEVVLSDTPIYKEATDESIYLNIHDTCVLKNFVFRIDKVSDFGDSIKLTLLNIKKDSVFQENLKVLYAKRDIISGKAIDAGVLKNKYIFLDFWGTWCAPCIELTDSIKKIYFSFIASNPSQIQLISVGYDRKESLLKNYIQEKNIKWPNIFQSMEDSNYQSIIKHFNIAAYPTFILMNNSGEIIERGIGETGLIKIEKFLKGIFY
jgi:thiol-disulfide isomerase/thioredoxin